MFPVDVLIFCSGLFVGFCAGMFYALFTMGSPNSRIRKFISTSSHNNWKTRPRPQVPGFKETYLKVNPHCTIIIVDSPYKQFPGWYTSVEIGKKRFNDDDLFDEQNRPLELDQAKVRAESLIEWCEETTEDIISTYSAKPKLSIHE